jgi:hypothetical protein
LTINDTTTGKSFTTQQTGANMQRSSAEWVVEAPTSGSVLPLANFGTATFTSASATINGTTGPINDSAWSAIAIDMASRFGATEATTSILNTTGDGFSVSYNSSGSSSGIGGFGLGGGYGWGGGFGNFGLGGFGGFTFSTNATAKYSTAAPSTSQTQTSQLAARDQLFASQFDFFRV